MAPPSGVNHFSNPSIDGDFASSYTERKSGLLKWLCKLFKGGSSRGGGAHHPQVIGEENMAQHAPARPLDDRARARNEKEELDHAVALSLSEDWKRSNRYGWRTDYDEDLARELPDSLNSSSYPPYVLTSSYPPYVPTPYYPMGCR
ncbi:protein DA1-related 2 isoform X1 [Tripterygium wilfordii]|uniref:Protein DA1-related 2 isoform X1 n=1 Tax=Tripterygium wilfordii TaxID=458696 RepID=A0A7J7C661_TRIWF|nr:protein DA1-related 2 isoform X1 [Tripterygium wilfordii]